MSRLLYATAGVLSVTLGVLIMAVSIDGASKEVGTADAARHLAMRDYRRPANVAYPEDNAFSPAREQLGRMLFFDPRLSGSKWISCATCHNPALAWGDGLPRAIGHGMQF
jgi:cytochrome c peroxidase